MIASGEQQSGLLHSEAALYNQQLVAHPNRNHEVFWGETKEKHSFATANFR